MTCSVKLHDAVRSSTEHAGHRPADALRLCFSLCFFPGNLNPKPAGQGQARCPAAATDSQREAACIQCGGRRRWRVGYDVMKGLQH